MNDWINQWMIEWMNKLMNEWIDEWMNEWMNKWMNEWMSEWMSECVNERMNEWVNEWIMEAYRLKYIPISTTQTIFSLFVVKIWFIQFIFINILQCSLHVWMFHSDCSTWFALHNMSFQYGLLTHTHRQTHTNRHTHTNRKTHRDS